MEKAEEYAKNLMSISDPSDFYHQEAMHYGHMVLGRVAIRNQRRGSRQTSSAAVSYFAKRGKRKYLRAQNVFSKRVVGKGRRLIGLGIFEDLCHLLEERSGQIESVVRCNQNGQ